MNSEISCWSNVIVRMANHTINKVGIKAGLVASRGTIEERFITFKINLSISKEETPPKAKPHPSVTITPSIKYKLVLIVIHRIFDNQYCFLSPARRSNCTFTPAELSSVRSKLIYTASRTSKSHWNGISNGLSNPNKLALRTPSHPPKAYNKKSPNVGAAKGGSCGLCRYAFEKLILHAKVTKIKKSSATENLFHLPSKDRLTSKAKIL